MPAVKCDREVLVPFAITWTYKLDWRLVAYHDNNPKYILSDVKCPSFDYFENCTYRHVFIIKITSGACGLNSGHDNGLESSFRIRLFIQSKPNAINVDFHLNEQTAKGGLCDNAIYNSRMFYILRCCLCKLQKNSTFSIRINAKCKYVVVFFLLYFMLISTIMTQNEHDGSY